MAPIGTPRLDRLATPALKCMITNDHRRNARLEASTATYSTSSTSAGVQSTGRLGTSSASATSTSEPQNIDQKVSASGSGWCNWNNCLVSTVPRAQKAPPAMARLVLCQPPRSCQGSMTKTSPTTATAMPNHWRGLGRSRSSPHANSTAQNGIV